MNKIKMKKIALVTPGRDCPGLNAFIRSVVRTAVNLYQMEIVGGVGGFLGLIVPDFIPLNNFAVSEILFRGGTILKTYPQEQVFFKKENLARIQKNLKDFQIDGLVIAGGQGTLEACQILHNAGIPLVFVPATIDNNLPQTEMTLGFDSALNNLVGLVDKIKDTAASNPRIFIVELADDRAGFLTLFLGLASGIERLFLPEPKKAARAEIAKLLRALKKGIAAGKNHQIILTNPAAFKAEALAQKIRQKIELPIKTLVIAEIEKGGSPSARDLILAAVFGSEAVKILAEEPGVFLGFANNQLVTLPLKKLKGLKKELPKEIIRLQREIAF